MRILLIFPTDNLQATIGKGKIFVQATEPHNLLSLAAFIREKGFNDVKIVDSYALNLSHRDILKIVSEYDPHVIGITCYTSDSPLTIKLCKQIKLKYPNKCLVVGGVHATVFYEQFLRDGSVDFIVYGEGEETLYRLLLVINRGGCLDDVNGIIYNNGSKIIKTEPRPFISNLDSLPKPAWDLVPMHIYRLPFYFHPEGNRSLITSRGCPVGCSFCAVHQGKRIRYQSAERIMSDFRDLITYYNAKHIHFMDSLFVGSDIRIEELADRLIKEGRKISWSCSAHVNFINVKLLKLMKKAGCTTISYGIESGVQELLDNVNKRTKIEKIREVIMLTKESGIRARGLFMLGLPGETEEKSLKTIQFAKELPLDGAQFAITTPYPGTELYYQLVKENKIDALDWERYSAYSTFTDKEPIYVPEGMNSKQLLNLQTRAIVEFYFRPRQIYYEMSKIRVNNVISYFKGLKVLLELLLNKAKQ